MEFLGSVRNEELGWMKQYKEELGLSDDVICFERQNEAWTDVLVDHDKLDYWGLMEYVDRLRRIKRYDENN